MAYSRTYLDEIQQEVAALPAAKRKRVLEFIRLLKFEKFLDAIDPEQAYFWTPKWQEKERAAEEDVRAGRVNTYHSIEEHRRVIERMRKGK